ncbi:hypothetical protein EOM09_07365 [bacterium]|nr:hypothetical protein [bacterium]
MFPCVIKLSSHNTSIRFIVFILLEKDSVDISDVEGDLFVSISLSGIDETFPFNQEDNKIDNHNTFLLTIILF